MAEEKKNEAENKRPAESPSPLEWIFAAVGVLAVLSAIVFLIYRGATKGDAPPRFQIDVESITQSGESYLVALRVTNTSDRTAAAVTIEGELKNGEKSEETSAATMTYVPARSVRRSGLFFSKNPHEYQIRIRAKGFEQP
jgi:uncharacterized protein (TIGR02588 family)